MSQTGESRPGVAPEPAPELTTTTASLPRPTDSRPWWDHVDWSTEPALAYAKGLHDGIQLGLAEYDAELVAALTSALGAPGDRAAAVGNLIRWRDQVAARGGARW